MPSGVAPLGDAMGRGLAGSSVSGPAVLLARFATPRAVESGSERSYLLGHQAARLPGEGAITHDAIEALGGQR
jgi:hypothetical protein